MRSIEPTDTHREAMDDIKAIIGKHKHLPPEELLALGAQMVGNLIALQDQQTMTPERAMAIVSTNIEAGNAAVIQELLNTQGGA